MYKLSLAGSALLSLAQAITLRSNAVDMPVIKPTGLAQTSADTDSQSGCGCGIMMAVGCCEEEEEYEPEPPVPPKPDPETPIGNIEMNLDVLLTHILHEVHPDPADIEMPETNTPEE